MTGLKKFLFSAYEKEKIESEYFFQDDVFGLPLITLMECFGEIMSVLYLLKTNNTFECVESKYYFIYYFYFFY